MHYFQRSILAPLLASVCLFTLGCSNDSYEGPELLPIEGTVTLDSSPLADADLTFLPTGTTPGQGAYGRTDADGHFTLRGHTGREGVAAGSYRVIITKSVMPDGSPAPAVSDTDSIDSPARQILADRYSSIGNSELTASVEAGVPLRFELTSKQPRRKR